MRLTDGYRPHSGLTGTLRGRAQLWRLFAGLAMIAAVTWSFMLLLRSFLAGFMPGVWISDIPAGNTPGKLLVLLFGFGGVILGVQLTARVFQRRGLKGVTGPVPLFWRQFGRVLLYLLALTVALSLLPPYDMGEPLDQNLPFSRWLALLPLGLAALLIQTGAEEILFRGYIQQTLAARFRSPLVFLLVPSGLFALGHYLPAEAGDNAGLIALWAGVFGVLMADLTARAGSLGPAVAVHFFNNLTAMLLIASPTSLNGLALYLQPYGLSDTEALRPWLIVDFALMTVSWLVARLAIRR
jgi:membrane protease YdiL (CAAX protease family)